MTSDPDLGVLYRDTRQRVTALVNGLTAEELATPVPACPAWTVRDVLGHLTAVAEDAVAGRLTGPPSEEQTAAQVDRLRGQATDQLLATWAEQGAQFEPIVRDFSVWPAVIDAVSHEHDIRGALGRPGERDSETVRAGAAAVIGWFTPPIPVVIKVEDAEFRRGPDAGEPIELTTTRFEALRFRMGRRSRSQLSTMDWHGDPAEIIDGLVVFGPAEADVLE